MLQLASKGGSNQVQQPNSPTGPDRIRLQSVYPKQKKIPNPYYSSSTDTFKPYSNCHHQHRLSTPATSLQQHHRLRSPLSIVTLSLSLSLSLSPYLTASITLLSMLKLKDASLQFISSPSQPN